MTRVGILGPAISVSYFTFHIHSGTEAGKTQAEAARQTAEALDSYELPELRYFREHFLGSFQLTLDEME